MCKYCSVVLYFLDLCSSFSRCITFMRWYLTASSLVPFPWKHDIFMYIRKLLSVCYVLKIMRLKAKGVLMAKEKDVNVEKEETNGIN